MVNTTRIFNKHFDPATENEKKLYLHSEVIAQIDLLQSYFKSTVNKI